MKRQEQRNKTQANIIYVLDILLADLRYLHTSCNKKLTNKIIILQQGTTQENNIIYIRQPLIGIQNNY